MTGLNILQQTIRDQGGAVKFAKRCGPTMDTTSLRLIARGQRIPRPETRRTIVRAAGGRLTEEEIIAITGTAVAQVGAVYNVHPMWNAPEDELRHWIWSRETSGAAATRRGLVK